MISRYAKAIIKGSKFLERGLVSKKPVVAYVGGFLGEQNLGDEALFMAAKLLFNKYELLYFDGSRTQTSLFRYFPYIKTGILAGGTLINRAEDCLKVAEKYFEVCPSLSVFGTGVANSSFWEGRSSWVNMMDKWKPLLEKCNYIGVRGPLSAEQLTDAGIKNVEIVGDPVLVFAENEINYKYVPNSIGLNIGQSGGVVWGDESRILSEVIKLANLAREAKWTVKWFVVWPKDLEITQKAANISKTSEHIYEIYDDHKKYIELVKPLSTFVGMKLHATILATCAFVPSIMLEYRPKCLDYMESIGQGASNIRTDKFQAENVWEIVCSWNSERHEKAETRFKSIKTLQKKQLQKAGELMNRIDAGI